MWLRQRPQDRGDPLGSGPAHVSDLGSQLEDLIIQVLRCERWARFDDRIDLALAVDRVRPQRARRRR
jgi:hypothetical protein